MSTTIEDLVRSIDDRIRELKGEIASLHDALQALSSSRSPAPAPRPQANQTRKRASRPGQGPPVQPKDPDELIVPARDGALRVLRAALDAGVERMVMTSSVAAVRGARPSSEAAPYTEADWTDGRTPRGRRT